jgi:hypothetical protein
MEAVMERFAQKYSSMDAVESAYCAGIQMAFEVDVPPPPPLTSVDRSQIKCKFWSQGDCWRGSNAHGSMWVSLSHNQVIYIKQIGE